MADNVKVLPGGSVPGLVANSDGSILVAEYNIPSANTFNDEGEHVELVSLRINTDGSLSDLNEYSVAGEEGVNWPSAGGFAIERRGDREFVVVTEVRDWHYDANNPMGVPDSYQANPLIQFGTVTSLELFSDGSFVVVNTVSLASDELYGACWIVFNEGATDGGDRM